MKTIRTTVLATAAAMLALLAAPRAFAQADPPGRVARLNLAQGSISFLPSGGTDDDWVQAVVNRPLTTGDRVWADANSRAEIHVGSAAIRMDSNTGISFLNLDDATVQLRLTDGSIYVRVRHLDPNNTFEIDTPNVAFAIHRPGVYRLDAHPSDATTVITVRQGEGEAIGGGRNWDVRSDQQVLLAGNDSLDYDLKDADAQQPTDFDRWSMDRDAREDRIAPRYVSPEMTGYEDLDAYGEWRDVPGYGWCWAPAGVAVGWAPYRYGHWVWVSPWGWTWVEDEPWGFAPFHYGRWAFYGAAWVWVPGPAVVRPVYAPALVAWVGGGGFSVGVGVGVGWFPLGPREVFVPSYRVSETYVTRVNVTNTVVERTTVINVYHGGGERVTYVNQRVGGGVTVVDRETFINARPVAAHVVRVDDRVIVNARVGHEAGFQPERASVYGAGRRDTPHPPAEVVNRTVITHSAPPREPDHFARTENGNNRPADRPAGNPQAQPPQNSQRQDSGRQQDNRFNRNDDRTMPAPAHPAPPVRQASPQERQNEQQKQQTWQNAHPRNDDSKKSDSKKDKGKGKGGN
ncbi:MAG TPA: DUF6600 domain-containing protein [Candidatus Acidoferrales bacterium]|nr:DUF6600 domain-containing protein [Candidatus Acidoferrales bacterium]